MSFIFIAISHGKNKKKEQGESEAFKEWIVHVGGEHIEDNEMDDIFKIPAEYAIR
jgi:hypothetical protein